MKILHTADWQIGMRARHVGQRASDVRAQRIASANALVALVQQHEVDAVFVAGDVFEDNAVERADVQRGADICARFEVPTYVLPGNHDPLVAGSVWQHPAWDAAANVTVLRTAEPLRIAPGVMLYPCPATAKLSPTDPTGWISDTSFEGTRIGIAHGTVTGHHTAEDCYPIRPDAATVRGLDYLALGHWHSTAMYEGTATAARMAYSGTHETTKFGERDSGNVLIVDVPGRGAMPKIEKVETGALVWHLLGREVGTGVDLESLVREVEAIPGPERSLLELRLTGALAPHDLPALDRLREIIEARFPLLGRLDASQVIASPHDTAWATDLPAGSLRDVATHLRSTPGDAATQALLLLYRFGVEAGLVAR